MSRFHSYINSASKAIESYQGEEPFASFLKKFFSLDKKYGSKDRKQVSHLCYCYFRTGKLKTGLPVEERLLIGLFLCSAHPNEILQQLRPEWNEKVAMTISEKFSLLNLDTITDIFPFADELSNGIEREPFILSHLQQPDLFLRLRPGKEEKVKQKLSDNGIPFDIISASCLSLPNASKIDSVITLNKEAVVQDYSSQRVGELMSLVVDRHPLSVWDCCAASGGKSIMLYDLNHHIDLTVSDIRESILVNLKKRFTEAGITNYKSIVADLAHSTLVITKNEATTRHCEERSNHSPLTTHHSPFDLIIADVPCSGSGTWGRAPENLLYFESKKIGEYAALQKKIVSNVIPRLAPGGYLLYITCSVFKKENEEAVGFIQQHSELQLIKMEVLAGYDKKADTLFAALLRLSE